MNRYYKSFSPPLRSFLLQRGRDQKKISTGFRRDLRERSRERGGSNRGAGTCLAPPFRFRRESRGKALPTTALQRS